MKSKDEIEVDKKFDKFGIKLRIYHFTKPIFSFNAITIVTNDKTKNWKSIAEDIRKCLKFIAKYEFNKSTELLYEMGKRGYHGIAVCDRQDTFNRQRGRTIAKGRLLKHIKKK